MKYIRQKCFFEKLNVFFVEKKKIYVQRKFNENKSYNRQKFNYRMLLI